MRYTRRDVVTGGIATIALISAGCLGDESDDDADDHHDDHHDDHDDHHHDDEEGHFDHMGIEEFQLLERHDDHDHEIAYMHGDHWHDAGEFPTVPLDETIEIGAAVETDDGDEIDLGGEYELRAEVAEGGADIVTMESHGDHVDITGNEEGVTEIVFMIWHGDHADYQTAELALTVTDEESN